MGTLFETPHDLKVQFSQGGGGGASTQSPGPVKQTYPASSFPATFVIVKGKPSPKSPGRLGCSRCASPTFLLGPGGRNMKDDGRSAAGLRHKQSLHKLTSLLLVTFPGGAFFPGHLNHPVFLSLF